MSYAVAGAQTATTTTLAVTPASAANGSVFTMTATVKVGATSLTGGAVTFRDTYNSITQTLGTIQVESAKGGPKQGSAILHLQLGGIGTHSIVATFNGTKNNLTSSSTAQSVIVTGVYPTVASLVQTGGTTGSYALTTTIVGVGSLGLSPTGNVSLLDTSNSNLLLALPTALGPATFGQQTVMAGLPIAVGTNPQDVVAGDFNGDGNVDLAVLNSGSKTVSILLGNGDGTFNVLGTTYSTGNGPVALVTGDFDGDGNLDLAVLNATDQTVWVRLGNGNGTFGVHSR
ncbi:MAG: FG-GAP-like repeat-containing protein, partial [Edaphobacter sp.]